MMLPLLLALATPAVQDASPPRVPFATARRAGDTLYISGMIGRVPKGADRHGEGFDAAAREAMDRIGKALSDNGARWSQVVKCTVMLADIADWPRFNAVYLPYFKGVETLPARSAFAASGLAYDAPLEIECIAWLGK